MTYHKEENQLAYRRMTLIGKGQITVNPDLAIIRLGIETTGLNVTEAQAENARISQNILDALRELGISDIKTHQYQIQKIYDFENGSRIERGYSVRNIFEIRMNNLGLVGTAIDAAVSAGANIVENISFEVENPDFYYQQALNLAVKNAIQKAKSIASGLRIMIDTIPIKITESSLQPIPFSQTYTSREAVLATPIEPGSTQIEASAIVEFIY